MYGCKDESQDTTKKKNCANIILCISNNATKTPELWNKNYGQDLEDSVRESTGGPCC